MGTLKEILAAQTNAQNTATYLASPLGNWVYIIDANNYVFVALTSAQYPAKMLSALLAEIGERFYKENPTSPKVRLNPNEGSSEFLISVAKKYMSPSEYAEIGVNTSMHEIQLKIEESLKQAIENSNRPAVIQFQDLPAKNDR